MAITNGYATLAEVKAALRLTDSVDDTLIERAIESASRRIDGYCGRWFYKTSATPVNIYPINEYLVAFPRDVSSTSITIKIDTNADGTYATTLTQGVDYILEPTDAALRGYPYTHARMVGGQTFPLEVTPSFPTVQVTAQWGWNAIPSDVNQACVLLSMRQFARLNAALGVVGFADMAITVRAIDPDVRDLLNQFVLFGVI
jgi:Phage gp6-like head-tail connector protein